MRMRPFHAAVTSRADLALPVTSVGAAEIVSVSPRIADKVISSICHGISLPSLKFDPTQDLKRRKGRGGMQSDLVRRALHCAVVGASLLLGTPGAYADEPKPAEITVAY